LVFLVVGVFNLESVSAVQYANCAAVPSAERNQGGITRTCQEITNCSVLSNANRYYLLVNNITSNYTCLSTMAIHNSIINLNEYAINYNNISLNIPNDGFETGTFTGWNTANAPTATIIADPGTYMLDNYYARITSTSPQYIQSQLIHLPEAGQTYYAYMLPKGINVFIELVDSSNNQLCRTDVTSSYPGGKFMFYCMYRTTAPIDVYLRFGTLSSDGSTKDFDLVGLGSAYDYGIGLRGTSTSAGWFTDESTFAISNNVVIKNGIVKQGINKGTISPAVFFGVTSNSKVQNITTYTNGVQSPDIWVHGGANNEVSFNELHSSSPYTLNREITIGQIEGPDQQGQTNLSIHDNKLYGGPQGGIHAGFVPSAGSFTGDTITVYNNYIDINTRTTNGYALSISANNTQIYNNTINVTNGRGIALPRSALNMSIYNNYVNVIEKTPPEYSTQYGWACAHGIKMEFDSTYSTATIYNNTVISRTGPGTWGACPLSFGHGYANPSPPILIENNTFISQYGSGSEASSYSTAIQYYNNVPQMILKNNKFYSDNIFIMMAGGELSEKGPKMISNVFEKTFPEKTPFRSFYIISEQGNYNLNTEFINTTLIGSDYNNIQGGGVTWNFSVGWFLDVVALDGIGPANGANVTLSNRSGNVLFTNATTTNGNFRTNLTALIYNGNGSRSTTTTYKNYTVNVIYGDEK